MYLDPDLTELLGMMNQLNENIYNQQYTKGTERLQNHFAGRGLVNSGLMQRGFQDFSTSLGEAKSNSMLKNTLAVWQMMMARKRQTEGIDAQREMYSSAQRDAWARENQQANDMKTQAMLQGLNNPWQSPIKHVGIEGVDPAYGRTGVTTAAEINAAAGARKVQPPYGMGLPGMFGSYGSTAQRMTDSKFRWGDLNSPWTSSPAPALGGSGAPAPASGVARPYDPWGDRYSGD
jgi:hypothetical protein